MKPPCRLVIATCSMSVVGAQRVVAYASTLSFNMIPSAVSTTIYYKVQVVSILFQQSTHPRLVACLEYIIVVELMAEMLRPFLLSCATTIGAIGGDILGTLFAMAIRPVLLVHLYGLPGAFLLVFGSQTTWLTEAQVLCTMCDEDALNFKKSIQDECTMVSVAVCRLWVPILAMKWVALALTQIGGYNCPGGHHRFVSG